MAELFNTGHEAGNLDEYDSATRGNQMIRDILSGESYKVEYIRLEIVDFRNDRLAALAALRKLLDKRLEETQAILDSLPYVLYDGLVEEAEWLSLYRRAHSAGFDVRETIYFSTLTTEYHG